jgi:hypothetical protein
MSKVILAIDPSTVRVGWATLRLPLQPEVLYRLGAGWEYGSMELMGDTLADRMRSLEPLFEECGAISHLVVEKPTFFNSEAGRIAVREGHIIGLSIMLGYIMGKLELWEPNVTMYTPAQWKGMVPKDITRKKFFRTFQDAAGVDRWGARVTYDHDTIDAIMLLRFFLTRVKMNLKST